MIGWLSCLVLTVATAYAASALARRLVPGGLRSEVVLASCVLAVGGIIGETGILALWGRFRWEGYLFLTLTFILPLFLWKSRDEVSEEKAEGLPFPEKFLLMAGFTAWAAVHGHYATVLANGAPQFWDSLAYHLRDPVSWFQTGNLMPLPGVRPFGETAYFPRNGSLLMLWGLATGPGPWFAQLVQYPLTWAGGLGVFLLLRRAGSGAAFSGLGALWWLSLPYVRYQVVPGDQPADVDIALCSLLLLAGYWLVKTKEQPGWGKALLAGMALGIAFGTKTVGILFGAPLGLIGVWVFFQKGRLFIAFLSGLLAFGAPWYLHTWLLTGNPLYPRRIGGLFPGPADGSYYQLSPFGGYQDFLERFWIGFDLGGGLAVGAVILTIGMTPFLWRKLPPLARGAFGGAFWSLALFLGPIPYRNTRFLLPFVTSGIILAFVLPRLLPPRWRRGVFWVLGTAHFGQLASLPHGIWFPTERLLPWLAGLSAVSLFFLAKRLPPRLLVPGLPLAALGFLLLLRSSVPPLTESQWLASFNATQAIIPSEALELCETFLSATKGRPARFASAGTPIYDFPCLGQDFRNRWVPVSRNEESPWGHLRQNRHLLGDAHIYAWLRNLQSPSPGSPPLEYLILFGKEGTPPPVELEVVKLWPEAFHPLIENKEGAVYRIEAMRLPSEPPRPAIPVPDPVLEELHGEPVKTERNLRWQVPAGSPLGPFYLWQVETILGGARFLDISANDRLLLRPLGSKAPAEVLTKVRTLDLWGRLSGKSFEFRWSQQTGEIEVVSDLESR